MLRILSDRRAPPFGGSHQAAVLAVARMVRAQAAALLQLLILLLVGLLFVFISLMIVTGHVEVGGPVLGSVLLIGFIAAQFSR